VGSRASASDLKVVCSIGTTEPHHAVGLGLDACVFSELGVRSVSVVAAVSAQDAGGVHALVAMNPTLIEAQITALGDVDIDAYRIGALVEEKSAESIAHMLTSRDRPIVYDPVASASRGGTFADSATLKRIAARLLPLVAIITPNLSEAQLFTGANIHTVQDMIAAASTIAVQGARAVLVKGGHLEGDPQDVLFVNGEAHVFTDERIPGEMRGTGCVLAACLAALLAQGVPLLEAVRASRAFVRKKIASSLKLAE
jgi:hydroxymethylpyrimidine kinase/phosphomethylpyrimidine kinase